MKVLIIEDDPNKLRKLREFIVELRMSDEVFEEMSYQSGIRRAVTDSFDVILLDMTMPVFGAEQFGASGATRLLAGRDVLSQLDEREIDIPVIVVTQFEEFGEPGSRKSLQTLDGELRREFPRIYLGSVYYNSGMTAWKDELSRLLRNRRS